MELHTDKMMASKYEHKTTLAEKAGRWLKKNFFVAPLFALALGLAVYIFLAHHHQWPALALLVNYDHVLTDDPKMEGPQEILDSYRGEMKEEKTGRGTAVLSGEKLLTVSYGTEIKQFTDISQAYRDSIARLQAQLAALKIRQSTALPATGNRKRRLQSKQRRAPPAGSMGKMGPEAPDSLKPTATAPRFHTLKPHNPSSPVSYLKVYVNGQQEIGPGSYVRLRLGEDLTWAKGTVRKNTLFYGKASANGSKMLITVTDIGACPGPFTLLDSGLTEGMIVRRQDGAASQALEDYLYRSAPNALRAIPVEAIRQVGRNLAARKRAEAGRIILPDGYPLYLNYNPFKP